MKSNIFKVIVLLLFCGNIYAQEKQISQEDVDDTVQEGQSRDSQAMDATAAQWSFQAA